MQTSAVMSHPARVVRPAPAGALYPQDAAGPRGLESLGSLRTFARDAELYAEGDRPTYFYKVVTGAFRTYKVLTDGRRQVGAFYLPGDLFGQEAGEERRFSAEAVADATAIAYPRRDLEALVLRGAPLAHRVVWATLRDHERAQEHMLVLGRKTTRERVATFLLDMASRAPGNEIDLPMLRCDIADYLGLTVETVSRTLKELEREAIIALPASRHVVLRNRAALDRLNA
ncbi:helix-turn-helix domain-containing protein [Chelatococcus sp. SYSU_G07232]|uniref:Helix-turn-helix domain-containing protein n=1 Tax=Chelatococcus albus TaxID=3047466 RepID=A0ABT7ADE1_9HYPH|nr:helix-turn-helix domain-containing protein [Chelatococcus sp. SYSU_G07232]MDJ1156641.1 helix-turn-helix domain-containing protein [Chelatococcus sp. SYSU_G07232]